MDSSNSREPEALASDDFRIETRDIRTDKGATRLSYLRCQPLDEAGFVNAFSTRLGGVSPFANGALSLGYSKADTRENVDKNRHRFLTAIGAQGWPILAMRQTHSADRYFVESLDPNVAHNPSLPQTEPKSDALVGRVNRVLLAVQSADCLPILIGDPKTRAMAAIHAGWRGTAGRITERTVADLMRNFGVNPRDALAALGPVACGQCYEVGTDVTRRFKQEFGYWKKLIKPIGSTDKAYLDIRAANVQQLEFCGFTPDRIFVAPFCTMHQNELFFSYRMEGGGGTRPVGRLLSVIGRS